MTIKEKILDKSHELFVKNGIRSVTMDEIAQSLGMSKRTIYEQFQDKKTLVHEDAKYFAGKMKSETDRMMLEADNVIQGMTSVMHFVKGMLGIVSPIYFLDMKRYYPMAFEQIAQNREMRKLDVSDKLIKRGIEEGVFRSDLNVELVSYFMNGVIITDHEAMCTVSEMKYGDYERDVLFAYMSGISTEKGRVLIEEEREVYFQQMNLYGVDIPKFKF
jgi:AcrR family transcriptional regulator